MGNRGEAHMFYLAREVGKICRCSCWEKDNFIMINEFKYHKPEQFDHLCLVYHFTVPLYKNEAFFLLHLFDQLHKYFSLMTV